MELSSLVMVPVWKICRTTIAIVITLIALPALAGQEVIGKVTRVRDADTIEVRGIPIRFDGVDAPEMDEPGGPEGQAWMLSNYGGQAVRCLLTGTKTYDRWVGTCFGANGENISAAVIGAGLARDCPRYSGGKYRKHETAMSRSRPMKSYCR